MAIKIANNTVINDSRGLENITNLKTVNSQNVLGTGNIDTDTLPVGALQYFSGAYSTGPLQQFLRGSYGLSSAAIQQQSNIVFGNGIFVVAVNTTDETVSGHVFISQDGFNWENVPTSPKNFGSTPQITFGNGIFVIVTLSAIYTSTDARTWATVNLTAVAQAQITFGNGLFLRSSVTSLFTSTDAITWTARTSGTTSTIRALHHGGGLYLYGTNGGGLATSTDAITWTQRTSGTTSSINALFFANSLYLYGSQFQFATSTDAVTWTNRGTRSGGVQWFTYYNNLYLMGAVAGQVVHSSPDGATWTPTGAASSIPNWNTDGGQSESVNRPAIGNNRIVFPGLFGQCRVSLDTPYPGSKWLPVQGQLVSRSTYPQLYAQVGTREVFGSPTNVGFIETLRYTSPTSADFRDLATNTEPGGYTFGPTIVAVGNGGQIATSTDALTWTARTSGTAASIISVIHVRDVLTGGQYVYAGAGGVLATSTDAITWTARTSGTTTAINRLTYGNGLYMYATSTNSIHTSTDAVTWTQRTTGEVGDFGTAVFAGEYFFSWLRYSRDGINWISNQNGFYVKDVAFGNGVYVMVSDNQIALSYDGINTAQSFYTPGGAVLNRVKFLDGRFVAYNSVNTSAGPFCGWSTDGLNWMWDRNFFNGAIEFFNNHWVFNSNETLWTAPAYAYNTQTDFVLPFIKSNITAIDNNTVQDKLYIKALP